MTCNAISSTATRSPLAPALAAAIRGTVAVGVVAAASPITTSITMLSTANVDAAAGAAGTATTGKATAAAATEVAAAMGRQPKLSLCAKPRRLLLPQASATRTS